MKRGLGVLAVTAALMGGLSGEAVAAPNVDNASCMGLGSYFYAQGAGFEGATGVRADVQHLVKEFFSPAPGQYLRDFAQEKEGGSIPEPCGARIE